MGVKRRRSKRKTPITDAERAWLIGDDKNSGFVMFGKPTDAEYLQRLWNEHGDHARYQWMPEMNSPKMKEAADRGRDLEFLR